MSMVEDSFVPTVFSHNRDRLIIHDVAGEFLRAIVEQARKAKLMSAEHFTIDGTLIESWASIKSFKKKGGDDDSPPDDPGNPTVDFHGEKRNDPHESTTDPDAKLARKRKGKEAKLSYSRTRSSRTATACWSITLGSTEPPPTASELGMSAGWTKTSGASSGAPTASCTALP
jgi:hypothetical protein